MPDENYVIDWNKIEREGMQHLRDENERLRNENRRLRLQVAELTKKEN